jgi:PilZ domain
MKKITTICFRTSNEIRVALETIAENERHSLSSVIESILFRHLKETKTLPVRGTERRRYDRKKVSVPALIRESNQDKKDFETGTIQNISLYGLGISMPKGTQLESKVEGASSTIEVTFTLPNATQPLRMKCQPQRASDAISEIIIGAAIVDSDFNSYRTLQNYLM